MDNKGFDDIGTFPDTKASKLDSELNNNLKMVELNSRKQQKQEERMVSQLPTYLCYLGLDSGGVNSSAILPILLLQVRLTRAGHFL
jgi:activator of 2-hydroxyglutaryl-CoA dehydratase